jgi:hypothetical protein
MIRRGLLVLAAAGVLVTPTAAPAASPPESIGIRLLGRGPYLELRLAPGATAVREVAVSSTLSRPAEVPLLAVSARTTSGQYQTIEQSPDWLRVQPSVLHFDAVPPGKVIEQAATITITVPLSTRPSALQAAVLAVAPPSAHGRVRMINRVGLRVYLTVAEETIPKFVLWLAIGVAVAGGAGGLWALSRHRRAHRHASAKVRRPLTHAGLGT